MRHLLFRSAASVSALAGLSLALSAQVVDFKWPSAPPQDQGLPYTASGQARALTAIRPYIALFANPDYGSRYAYAHGYKIRLDDAQPLGGEPLIKDGVIYVPLAFAGIVALPEIRPAPAPEYLRDKWVYSLERAPIPPPNSTRTLAVQGSTYVALADIGRAMGYNIYQSSRGLVLLSREPIVFNAADAVLLDNIVTLFDTPDKLADPDIATRSVPLLKLQGRWTDHVKATPTQLALLAGPETVWPTAPTSSYDLVGFDTTLLGTKVPRPGEYPRLLFSAADLPAIYTRMQASKVGQKTLIDWDVMFHRSWLDPKTSDGQLFVQLTRGVPPISLSEHRATLYNSHVNYISNSLTTLALYCLLTGNDAVGKQTAAAVVNYYLTIEPRIDELNATADSEFGVNFDRATSSATGWRGMHGLVGHMDLGLCLDFAGKWMTPAQKDTMRRIIAKATYGRRDNMQAAPTRVRDINHMTWHLTNFLAASAIEGLEGCDPEVIAAGQESAKAFLDWGIDEHGQIFESNGKSGGGINFQVLSMITLARRGDNLFGHPHLRRLLAAQVLTTSPDGRAVVSSGTYGGSEFAIQTVANLKAFYPSDLSADWLLSHYQPPVPNEFSFDPTSFDPVAYRAARETSISRLRLPGPTYPNFTYSGLYNTDWRAVTRDEAKLPTTFNDPVHGVLSAYSDNTPDAAWLCLLVRNNQYIGSGHHHADVGMFYFSALGVNWITESPFLQSYDGKYHNEVLVDGVAEPDGLPARGDYLGASVAPLAAFGTADQTKSYTYKWTNQVMLWQPSTAHDVWSDVGRREWEFEDDPLALSVYKGTQHWKSRAWWPSYVFSNWIPVVRSKWNPVRYAFRTAGLVRGAHSYGLVVDDLKKDEGDHFYQWTAMLGPGVTEIKLPGLRADEIALVRKGDLMDNMVKPGAPLLFIRALDATGRMAAKVELGVEGAINRAGKAEPYDRVTISLHAIDARLRVLLIPARMGEARPEIAWDTAHGTATIAWRDQSDRVTFVTGNDQRTHFTLSRQGETLLTSR